MKVSEAIEIMDSFLLGTYDHRDKDLEDAFKLGIEALKRVELAKTFNHRELKFSLPGETPEEEVKS